MTSWVHTGDPGVFWFPLSERSTPELVSQWSSKISHKRPHAPASCGMHRSIKKMSNVNTFFIVHLYEFVNVICLDILLLMVGAAKVILIFICTHSVKAKSRNIQIVKTCQSTGYPFYYAPKKSKLDIWKWSNHGDFFTLLPQRFWPHEEGNMFLFN